MELIRHSDMTPEEALMAAHLNELQRLCLRTWNVPGKPDHPLYYLGLGLGGEAGEALNKLKKVFRGDAGLKGTVTAEAALGMAHELFDAFWYISSWLYELGFSLGEVMVSGVRMLADRRLRGVIKGSGDDR